MIERQLIQASRFQYRQLLTVSGKKNSCLLLAHDLLNLPRLACAPVWLGSGAPQGLEAVSHSTANTLLGNEFSTVVVNAFDGFECDAVAALEGTITAGGALLLITPDLQQWPTLPDPALQRVLAYQPNDPTRSSGLSSLFLSRLVQQLKTQCPIIHHSHNYQIRALATPTLPPSEEVDTNRSDSRQDQAAIIQTLVAHPQQRSTHSLLLTADRGRGKSAALGIAAAQLLRDSDINIIISAPGKRATQVFFKHLQQAYPAFAEPCASLRCVFTAPDQLSKISLQSNDLLIIDEAASIPLPLLVDAAKRFAHAVFSTTEKGYEGAGRGFAIRFSQLLQQHKLSHNRITLQHPIRWRAGDPLESFCNQAFVLDSPLKPRTGPERINPHSNRDYGPTSKQGLQVQIQPISQSQLRHSEQRLRELFGLLLQAHYKTTPNDLRLLLDGKNLRCYTLEIEKDILGAVLLADEGPITELPLRQGILRKRRRPSGHLLPQLLTQYTGCASALDLNIARVVRIAIHPEYQNQGLGSLFLQSLAQQLQQEKKDAIGTLFSAVPQTVNFWQKNHYLLCHLGARPQSSSGFRSITMLHPLSSPAKNLSKLAHALFQDTQQFHHPIQHPIQDTHRSPAAFHSILDTHNNPGAFQDAFQNTHKSSTSPAAPLYDQFVLQRYAAGERSFMDSHAALARGVPAMLDFLSTLDSDQIANQRLLRALQSSTATPGNLSTACLLHSKHQVEINLRSIVKMWLAANSLAVNSA